MCLGFFFLFFLFFVVVVVVSFSFVANLKSSSTFSDWTDFLTVNNCSRSVIWTELYRAWSTILPKLVRLTASSSLLYWKMRPLCWLFFVCCYYSLPQTSRLGFVDRRLRQYQCLRPRELPAVSQLRQTIGSVIQYFPRTNSCWYRAVFASCMAHR